jgi:hypothetical protein
MVSTPILVVLKFFGVTNSQVPTQIYIHYFASFETENLLLNKELDVLTYILAKSSGQYLKNFEVSPNCVFQIKKEFNKKISA